MTRRASIRMAALVLLSVAACAPLPGSSTTECEATRDGGLNCQGMCEAYCRKLVQCGVMGGDGCVEDCRTLTESGTSQESYQCVIKADCAQVSNCGI